MTTSTKPETPDLAALAAEACDLWQAHLASCAEDPVAKAAMMRLLEPQRQLFASLFADTTAIVQNARHAASPPAPPTTDATSPASGTATAGAASDDVALRMAQLAHRMAQLEKHTHDLDKRLARIEHGGHVRAAKTAPPPEQD